MIDFVNHLVSQGYRTAPSAYPAYLRKVASLLGIRSVDDIPFKYVSSLHDYLVCNIEFQGLRKKYRSNLLSAVSSYCLWKWGMNVTLVETQN